MARPPNESRCMIPQILPMTRALLIANCVVFLLQMVLSDALVAPFALWPINLSGMEAGNSFMPWQLLTAGFMHGSFLHLAFNMLALWMFGSPLEAVWGEKRFLTYFLACVIGGNLCQLAVVTWMTGQGFPGYATLGASGGVYGLLLGFGMLFPNQRMIIFPFPMEIRARTLVIIYGALAVFFAVTGTQSGVAHLAHLGGMLFGWLLIRYWRGQPPFGKRRPPPPRMRIVK